ncbi:patatin-like phospholipase family protein [Ferruginibacter yonginensis]|uniref:Patatin-like phospholipase family protein n=1 Tax=Ferruginibacter yonginensis TaxID=1310416 RepID=A0ABV8QSL1_9BACT
MVHFLKNVFYSLPVQLLILHFRKYQVLLFFWAILFSTVASVFMKTFGADALFFSPEYLGSVNILGAIITGLAMGVFIMSWNVTTFILHSRRLKFLATTANPFLKYCINNSLIPISFLTYYFIKLYHFNDYKELMNGSGIAIEMLGIFLGIFILLLITFAYFFTAGKTIERSMIPIITNPDRFNKTFTAKEKKYDEFGLKVYWYLNTGFKISKCRNVAHYRQDYLDTVFKRHHLVAILSIVLAFALIVTTGFLQEHTLFEIPAAASIITVFALLIAVIGALTYFLQSWSLVAVIIVFGVLNLLYEKEIIDPRNKAYGLNYTNKLLRPAYNKHSIQALNSPAQIEADKQNMLTILNKWKAKQKTAKPLLVFINVSGGGLRSAAFTMNVLQQTDSLSNGALMNQTFLMSGASGGMLAAAYYRGLYVNKLKNPALNIYNKKYTDNISKDLLNPVFTSLMARDIFAPIQKFDVGNKQYVKDRGYAFERKLGQNTEGVLNKQLKDFYELEKQAAAPLIFFNAVIKTDARKLIISTQPVSFMMKPTSLQNDTTTNADAVDFAQLFKKQDPNDLRILTALRMNATFPYVLPNVWLPSEPVIDVMDAGLRDNYGQETALRFIDNFKEWIKANTSGVLLVQIRDRLDDGWQQPFETKSVTDMIVTPATMLQHNWFKLQDFYQADQFGYFKNELGVNVYKATFMYTPQNEDKSAALNFHLSLREKLDVISSYNNNINQAAAKKVATLLQAP